MARRHSPPDAGSERAIQPAPQGQTLKQLLDSKSIRESVQAVVPRHVNAARLMKVAMVAVSKQKLLQECSQMSVVRCVMDAAELGLDVGGSLGAAYLVPFKDKDRGYEATLIIGYKGLISLADRSGWQVECRAVFQDDEFEIEFGLVPKLLHKPALDVDPHPEKLEGCYMIARHPERTFAHVDWMPRSEIDRIKARSRASGRGPWVTDYVEMAKKTVCRRGTKMLPLSVDFTAAAAASDAVEFGDEFDVIDTSATEIGEKPDPRKVLTEIAQEQTGEPEATGLADTIKKKQAQARKRAGRKPANPTPEPEPEATHAHRPAPEPATYEQKLQCDSCGNRDSVTVKEGGTVPLLECSNECGTAKPMVPVEDWTDERTPVEAEPIEPEEPKEIGPTEDEYAAAAEMEGDVEPGATEPDDEEEEEDEALTRVDEIAEILATKRGKPCTRADAMTWLQKQGYEIESMADENLFRIARAVANRQKGGGGTNTTGGRKK